MGTTPRKTLATFPNPKPERDYLIRFETPEFTCLCPKTGQPDFATVRVEYVPDQLCVELKSWKLYLPRGCGQPHLGRPRGSDSSPAGTRRG
jgi:7-cyano-7-deazaguanine reductase